MISRRSHPAILVIASLLGGSLLSGSLMVGAETVKPEIPDPYGLGERLALIDYLRERMGVKPPADATLEQLTALYWKLKTKGEEQPLVDDAALARDRSVRLRRELKEQFAIDAPATSDEKELGRLLAEAKSAAAEKAMAGVRERADAHDHPRTAEDAQRVADADRQTIVTRMDVVAGDIRGDRAAIATIERRRDALKADYDAAKKRLDELASQVEDLKKRYVKAVNDYNHEIATANVVGDVTRLAMDEASAAQKSGFDAYNRQVDVLKGIKAEDDGLSQQRERLILHVGELDQRQSEAARQLQELKAKAPDAGDDRTSPAAGTLETKLKSAVVLLYAEGLGSGTGFFVSADGLLVTNAHVVGDGKHPLYALWDASAHRQILRLRVVQILPADDLALLRAESGEAGFQALDLREVYDLQRPLIAVGFPLAGDFAATLKTSPSDIVMSRGTLSAVRHKGESPEWLQHDCKIASGNSGGPLVDQASGAVIGINTMVVSPEAAGGHGDSISLAIPIWKVKERFGAFIKR